MDEATSGVIIQEQRLRQGQEGGVSRVNHEMLGHTSHLSEY